ncbi:MAG: hypothetical protein LBV72_10185 [Tannerella sp.]|jgi:hypothetical protein|nr:hypothetical protein [Tannerella sp.]
MKPLLKMLGLSGLSFKHKLAVIYFCISLCLLSVSNETHPLILLAIVANFYLSVRLVKKVPLKIEID